MKTATESQLTSTVLMVRPVRFESNPHTAASNRFQGKSQLGAQEQQDAALREFDGLAVMLREAGIDVVVVDDTSDPHTPDSIFPNNWVSFHADGSVVLYPMEAENRRVERRLDIIEKLSSEFGFQVGEVIDLTPHEADGRFLEGTGSMVLDRINRVAYACQSSRTQLEPLGEFAQRMDYDVVTFDAVDRDGVAIYHTNVMMNIGEKIAVICDEAIAREDQRKAVMQSLHDSGREVLALTFDQMEAFAGNMLELRTSSGERLVAMSRQALGSLTDSQLGRLRNNGEILAAAIDTIEASAGGSVRCMLAEIHLPHS
ncbi:MAG: amidinotransferase [Desulfobulbaceae bacterium]|nr:amidinotransferase [Desulfobulbaceae bacterium]